MDICLNVKVKIYYFINHTGYPFSNVRFNVSDLTLPIYHVHRKRSPCTQQLVSLYTAVRKGIVLLDNMTVEFIYFEKVVLILVVEPFIDEYK